MKIVITAFFASFYFLLAAQNFYFPFTLSENEKWKITTKSVTQIIEQGEKQIDSTTQVSTLFQQKKNDTLVNFILATTNPMLQSYTHYYRPLADYTFPTAMEIHFQLNTAKREFKILQFDSLKIKASKLNDSILTIIKSRNPELVEDIVTYRVKTTVSAFENEKNFRNYFDKNFAMFFDYLFFNKEEMDTISIAQQEVNPYIPQENVNTTIKKFLTKTDNKVAYKSIQYYDMNPTIQKGRDFTIQQAKKYNQLERLQNEPSLLDNINFVKRKTIQYSFGNNSNVPAKIDYYDYQLSAMPSKSENTTVQQTIVFEKIK